MLEIPSRYLSVPAALLRGLGMPITAVDLSRAETFEEVETILTELQDRVDSKLEGDPRLAMIGVISLVDILLRDL